MNSPTVGSPAEGQNLRDQAYVGYTKSLLDRQIRSGQFITQRELVEITGLTEPQCTCAGAGSPLFTSTVERTAPPAWGGDGKSQKIF